MTHEHSGKHLDVIICGGGVIGICTAYFLAKRGVFSIVIEKDMIANAASGKAGGFMARDWNKGSALDKFSEASFDLHAELAKELNGETEYGYRRLTSHSLTLNEFASYSKPCHSNLPEWLDGDAIQAPVMQIGKPETNAQVHPYEFCQALRGACSNMGVLFLTKSEITNIVYSVKDKPKIVTINNHKEFSADVIVLTMGPWTGIAKKWFPTVTSSIYGQKGHSITIVPNEPLTPDAVFVSYDDCSPDIYPRPDGEAYVCGIVENPKPSIKLENPGGVSLVPGACEKLKTMVGKLSSSLREGKTNCQQACYLPLTEDGFPIIGKVPDYDGVYIAAGHGCWGILNAPITGKSISELIVDGTSILDLTKFSPTRCSE